LHRPGLTLALHQSKAKEKTRLGCLLISLHTEFEIQQISRAKMVTNSRPLHLQTIESLFAELIGGASVSVGEDGAEFGFSNLDSRSLLNWYRMNRAKWAGNVMTPDVEALVSSILSTPPSLPIPELVRPQAGRKLRLFKVTAHRFGGLHAYGTAAEAPPDFEFWPDKPITVFEGWNGAGKTSLLNSIIWCLTGSLLRPQRQPESGQEEFSSAFVRSNDDIDATTSHSLTPITPLPNPDFYVPPIDKPIPIDSWVELEFVDQDGNKLPAIRRTQLRNSRGKVSKHRAALKPSASILFRCSWAPLCPLCFSSLELDLLQN
jgi:hypothetical protein